MKSAKKMTKAEAIFLLIAGLILGTVFTFGMQYWNAPIAKDEARQVTAIFSSHEEVKRKGNVKEMILRFEDHEQLCIDGVCIDDELCAAIRRIEPGSLVEMTVHSNSNTILEMKVGAEKLLVFEDTVQKLSFEASGFMYIGIFCYILAVIGLFNLVSSKKR